MKPGENRSTWQTKGAEGGAHYRRVLRALRSVLCVLLTLLVGCAFNRGQVEKNLMADRNSMARQEGVAENYQVGCPDVLEVTVADRPDLPRHYTVGADGRIELGHYASPRVEGRTPAEVARLLADSLQVSQTSVSVRVAEYKSQSIILFCEVIGLQRSVSYQGQETVLDLLQRVGGITAGAAPQDVYIVRTHVTEGQRPEIYHVNLAAIVVNKDQKTNIRLLPYDQVYVGETRQARLEKCIPPWFRPVYQKFWGTRPDARTTLRTPIKEEDKKLGTWKRAKSQGDSKGWFQN